MSFSILKETLKSITYVIESIENVQISTWCSPVDKKVENNHFYA